MLCKEVSGAPTLEEFENTSKYCLAQRYNSFVDYEVKKIKELERKNHTLIDCIKKIFIVN
ncbi:hypothetical protein NPB89_003004 [Escherichia coli]|nr:hypothetical protein ECDEC14B_1108 [Escherichia coli DEC14B]EJM9633371.1 hypothetical protein [Escherichia coli]MDN0932124.1 hypothetical protein [Escherichia coli]HBC9989519.1 hypothetical protein [Escherichia coli]